jgi:hypothetical protein
LTSDPATEDLRLLELDVETLFAASPERRLLRQNPPDNGPAPRLFVGGCAGGNVLRLGSGVNEAVAADVLALAETEAAWTDPDRLPARLELLVERLPTGDAVGSPTPFLIYHLPNGLEPDPDVAIVRFDGPEGQRLLARLAEAGMPAHLVEAGFTTLKDLWAPWCAAMVDEAIAALCFAARIGPRGLEAGVYTFPGFRGRGLAAAVTAAWSSLSGLANKTLFYSTSRDNRSSQRVAERLGLRRFAVSLSLY